MNAAEFRQLRQAFHAVVELAPEQRVQHLAGLAAADPPLHEAVLGLLESFSEQDLHAADTTAMAPAMAGPYRLLQRLGSGGMGEVFLAERADGGFEQRVALKLVRAGALSAALTRRFLRERQILARLEHPHIARLLDGGFGADGRPWLAMEYVAGVNILRHALQQRLGLRERVALVAKVAAAVAYAQRNLIVHRDIKPANILIDAAGEPRLLDFGIAKLLDDGPAEQTRTAWRAMTLRYAAPEQIAGERCTTATDVYALGVLLFEVIAGCPPYRSAQVADADWAAAVLREAPRDLAGACAAEYAPRERRRLNGGLERIVQKALCKAPAQRYAGAAALADDLQDWLAQRPLRSGVGGAREQTRQLLQRYRWPLIAALASMLALGGGALLAWREARNAAAQARLARSHLDAMMNLLGAASPRHYAGRDPHASEFLLRAAADLQQRYGEDPALLQRALSEIGHGLINLGKPQQAEPLLRAAVAALEHDTSATTAGKLASYKLLAAVQDRPEDAPALRATAARIEALAARDDVDAGVAVDALGAAGGALSRLGEFAAADVLFARGDALLAAAPVQAGSGENYWRQRGWRALRGFDLAQAQQSFERAQAVITAQPAAFSPMRRAEGELLLAETALARGDAASAQRHLDAARPIYAGEYPPGHAERAVLELQQARLHLLRGESDAAQQRLDAAQPGLVEATQKDSLLAGLVQAQLAVAQGGCALARSRLDAALLLLPQLRPLLPREQVLARSAQQAVDAACRG
jgi:eukaryotic-like serine/threonine-protein kinase